MKLTDKLFEPHVDKEVIVHLDDGTPFPLTLAKVSTNAAAPEGESGEQPARTMFVMDLKGPREPVLPSLTYPVTIADVPTTHLFISAHAQDEEATYYNIVVS